LKNNPHYLYFVQTPLQILNAFEARERADGDVRHDLVIFEKENAYHNRLVENTLQFLKWKPLIVVAHPKTPLSKLLNWLILRRQIRRLPGVTKVHIGEYGAAIVVAAANLCTGADYWLVDDGTSSLSFEDFRYRGVRDMRYPLKGDMPLLGFRSSLPEAVTFFSIYDLELRSPDRLEKNTLSFLGRTVTFRDDGPVFFIGSPLPDNEEMSFDRFFELMRGVRHYFGDRRIKYFPHRAEMMDIKESVFARLRIEIVFNELPFELALAGCAESPSCVAGFYTTPLDTLRCSGAVPPDRLVAFYVASGEIQSPIERAMSETCYANYIATPGMTVVRSYT